MDRRFSRLALVAFVVAATAIAFLVARRGEKKPVRGTADRTEVSKPPRVPPDSLTQNRRVGTGVASTTAEEQAGEADPELIGVGEVLRAYRASVGENPIGSNTEITRALIGANSRRANFGGSQLTIKDGQIVDRWKHPYFFHQLSGKEMEIRSAGPDGVMWTQDDEVMR